jgi:hypothetical protein
VDVEAVFERFKVTAFEPRSTLAFTFRSSQERRCVRHLAGDSHGLR